MRRYRLYSMLIISFCALICFSVLWISYEQSQEVAKAQSNLKKYQESMSAPVDPLDPSSASAGSSTFNDELIIPKLGVDCTISSVTVNAYNTAYHYPESVDPGMPGECGLLSHRTTYSALFHYINTLKVGDNVIIKDNYAKKKYTYVVTSNGNDVRWDYKEHPIQFAQNGEARLLLVSCHPPGHKKAAWVTHCKLRSTSDI